MSLVLYSMTHRDDNSLGPSLQIGLQPGKRLANKAVTQLKPPDHYVVVDSVKGRTESIRTSAVPCLLSIAAIMVFVTHNNAVSVEWFLR